MMLNIARDVIYSSSTAVKKIVKLIPMQMRLGGRTFIEWYHFIKRTEYWNRKKLLRLQAYLLNRILKHAVKHVPFYRRLGIKLSGDPFKDLLKFPIVDKETIQSNLKLFISDNISSLKVYKVTTGGTSGRQLKFYLDSATYGIEWAFMINLWERVGYRFGDRVISIRGVEFKKADKGIFWQEQPVYNALELSPFHMSYNNLSKYVKIIKNWKPRFIHGYPSAITILAKYIIENRIKDIPKIRAILLCSEKPYPEQRRIIEKAFNARTFSWYGQSEKVVLAGECEHTTFYHVFPQYGHLELINPRSGEVLEEYNRLGEIVGTSFITRAMPFIRYRTGDLTKLMPIKNCLCGRHYTLIDEVEGRWRQEMIVGKSGTLFSTAAINIHSDVFDKVLRLFQKGVIEIAPLAFMRGRTLNDAFIILDEAQNTTSEQMKMFLTRLGQRSKAVITGDITQIDLPDAKNSGLIKAIEILEGIEGITFVYFTKQDVVRHPIVQKIIDAYESYEAKTKEK